MSNKCLTLQVLALLAGACMVFARYSNDLEELGYGFQGGLDTGAGLQGGLSGKRALRQLPNSRIVGGEDAPEGRFPYMLSLRNSDTAHLCGAVLVDSQFAVTAAHCVHPDEPNSVNLNGLVAIGAYGRGDDYTVPGVEIVKVKEVFMHPDYNASAIYHGADLAVLQLATPTDKTPISLPSRNYVPKVGRALLSLGWGSFSINLQQVMFKANSTRDCAKAWRKHISDSERFASNVVCAWNSTADTCRGDSGGPLIVQHKLRRVGNLGRPDLDTLVGVTSFGDPNCHRFHLPGVYTSIAKYVEWIEDIMAMERVDHGEAQLPSLPEPIEERKPEQGTPADHRFPYVASLQNPDREHKCAGVLVDPRWVLCAAQCVSNLVEGSLGTDHLVIKIGGYDAGDPLGEQGEITFPARTVVHNNFDGNPRNGYDIALIELPEPSKKSYARLPQKSLQLKEGSSLIKLGWSTGTEVKKDLQMVMVEILGLEACNARRSGWNRKVTSAMICTKADTPDVCGGDAGSPLLLPDLPKALQRGNPKIDIVGGIYSFGDGPCSRHSRPAVYTRVAYHLEWIEQVIDGGSDDLVFEPEVISLMDSGTGPETETEIVMRYAPQPEPDTEDQQSPPSSPPPYSYPSPPSPSPSLYSDPSPSPSLYSYPSPSPSLYSYPSPSPSPIYSYPSPSPSPSSHSYPSSPLFSFSSPEPVSSFTPAPATVSQTWTPIPSESSGGSPPAPQPAVLGGLRERVRQQLQQSSPGRLPSLGNAVQFFSGISGG